MPPLEKGIATPRGGPESGRWHVRFHGFRAAAKGLRIPLQWVYLRTVQFQFCPAGNHVLVARTQGRLLRLPLAGLPSAERKSPFARLPSGITRTCEFKS